MTRGTLIYGWKKFFKKIKIILAFWIWMRYNIKALKNKYRGIEQFGSSSGS